MKKFFICSIVILLLSGLGFASAETPPSQIKHILTEDFGFVDDELLEGFVAEYGITDTSYFEEHNIVYQYNSYCERTKDLTNDYNYILDAGRTTGYRGIDEKDIARILWLVNPNITCKTLLFDLKSNYLYVGKEAGILNNVCEADEIIPIDETVIDRLFTALEHAELSSWESYYKSTIDDSTGWLFWILAIEYNDGALVHFCGSGSRGDNMPETYEQLKEELWKIIE